MNVEKMEQDIGDHASQAETPQKSNKARRPKQRKVQRKPNKSKGNNKGNGEPTQTPEGPADFTPPQHQPRIFESEGNPRNATSTEKQSSAPKTAAVLKVAGPCPSAKMKKTHKKKAKQGKAQQKPQASPNTREDPEETLSQPAGSTSQDKGRHEVSRAEDRSKEDGAPAHEDANSQQATTGPDDDTAADLSKALQGVRFAEDQDPSGIQTPSPGGSSANVPAFKFDSMDPRLLCRRPHCRRMTSCWDSLVVICSACGPESYVRYCRKKHLFEDIRRHWLDECGRAGIPGAVDRDTIRPNQKPSRPYIIAHRHNRHNVVERHRQAVYRSMSTSDYFIFNDLANIDDDILEPSKEQWNDLRGTGEVELQVVFPDEITLHSSRRLFDHHIMQCLMFGSPMAYVSCIYAFHMIREALIISGNWTDDILTMLCMQLAGEWGDFKVPAAFYNVVEVNRMWQEQGLLPALPT